MIYAKNKSSPAIMTLIMLIIVGFTVIMQYRWNQTLDWKAVNVTMPTYRSADGQEMPPTYTKEELRTMASQLQDSVTESYKQANPSSFAFTFKPRANFRLETRVMEVFGGSVEIEVLSFNPSDETPVKEWKKDFANAEDFQSGVNSLADQIAGELTQLRK